VRDNPNKEVKFSKGNLQEEDSKAERLAAWFRASPQEWEDFKKEIEQCLINAEVALKAQGQKERDFYAGKCQGLQEILNIEREYK
jgi:hypothetical protein